MNEEYDNYYSYLDDLDLEFCCCPMYKLLAIYACATLGDGLEAPV
jgi:hypothetical protein